MADTFRGGNARLCECIDALLSLDASGSMAPHGIGGHARTLLESASARLRALSPAGGDWVASGFIRVGLTDVLVSDELSDFVGRKEVSREVHSMIHEDSASTRNDPHEFGAGIEDNPKAKYWQQRAAFWRETAKALGYVPPGEAIAASPQQEPGAPHWGNLPDGFDDPELYPPTPADESGAERRSTHHVHRGPESLPCYCDGRADHPIGQEATAPPSPSGQTLAGAGDLDLALDIAISGQEHAITARHAAEERLANAEAILQRVLHDLIAGSCVEDETQKALCTFLDPITFPIVTAPSAGTTGDDSEDAARYRWLRTCGVADDRAIHTRGYSELLSESALDAAIDARRAREVW